jgi:bifunctional non-homologous end joining protein LigD
MLLLPTAALPEGPAWSYELKLDGYRALAVKTEGKVRLRSRNGKDFNARYPGIVRGLANLRDGTVLDGEVVALDEAGRPQFNALQNFGSAKAPVFFYVFDVLVLAGRDVMADPLSVRREMLERDVLPYLAEPVRRSPILEASLPDLIEAVRAQGLEGIVAKRLDSRYESGQRSGAWQKMRVNRAQEFVIGGYTPGLVDVSAIGRDYQFRSVARPGIPLRRVDTVCSNQDPVVPKFGRKHEPARYVGLDYVRMCPCPAKDDVSGCPKFAADADREHGQCVAGVVCHQNVTPGGMNAQVTRAVSLRT